MSEPPTEHDNKHKSKSWVISVVAIVVLLLAAGGVAAFIFSTEPTAQKSGSAKKTAMLVEVVEAERGDFRPRIVAQGTVEAARDIVMRPQVDGRITQIAESFVPGGFVEEGELLLKIESADYHHALAQRQSELRQALSDLALEKGQNEAAQAEYEYIGEDLSEENKALVLRKPQLEAAQERVAAARAAVEQAELNLQRANVEAPFDAHIIRRDVNVGSQVSSNDNIARLVGVEEYWVGVELPVSKLRWVSVDEDPAEASSVRVRNGQSWPKDTYREGYLSRLIGTIDPGTRMARVLATIPDPLLRLSDEENQPDARKKPALMIGEFVEVAIEGVEINDVVQLHRDYVRENDTVWVMEDGKLQVKDVEIVMRDANHAYISAGLDDGAKVVTTNISTVVDGSPLRLQGSAQPGPDAGAGQPDTQSDTQPDTQQEAPGE